MGSCKLFNEDFADSCVNTVIDCYDKLPKTGKPSAEEWTVIAAIIEDDESELSVVSLGTGSKCIGRSFLCQSGTILNDAHAEIMARRGFIVHLYNEMLSWRRTNNSRIFNGVVNGKFIVNKNIRYYFVTSTVPCGDAAIIPVLESDSKVVETDQILEVNLKKPKRPRLVKPTIGDIFRTGARCLPSSEIQDAKTAGAEYHVTGLVRTKPGRGDPTASVSCSDKLARWNVAGIQGALISLLVEEPIYMSCVIVGGGGPFSEESLNRAVNDRFGTPGKVPMLLSRIPFPVIRTGSKNRPAPSSITWNLSTKNVQICVNGKLAGSTKKTTKHNSALIISKCKLLALFLSVTKEYGDVLEIARTREIDKLSYRQLKDAAVNYQDNWKSVKKKLKLQWTSKPIAMEDFVTCS